MAFFIFSSKSVFENLREELAGFVLYSNDIVRTARKKHGVLYTKTRGFGCAAQSCFAHGWKDIPTFLLGAFRIVGKTVHDTVSLSKKCVNRVPGLGEGHANAESRGEGCAASSAGSSPFFTRLRSTSSLCFYSAAP